MKKPLISVLLPCKNSEKTLGVAIQSILNQTQQDFELLFLDDGSMDSSLEIAKGFNDDRIKILSDGKSYGLASRLNFGILNSQGLFIARMDADDLSFSDRFERQVNFLQANPDVDLVSCKTLSFDDSLNPKSILPYRMDHQNLIDSPWKGFYMPHPSWLGRSGWFKKYMYKMPEIVRAEDQELLLRAMNESSYFSLPEILFAYRIGKPNMIKIFRSRSSLFMAQCKFFYNDNDFVNLSKSFLFFTLRLISDLSLRWFKNFRGNKSIPEETLIKFSNELKKLRLIS